jgi:transposase InsO family protein
MTARSYIEAGHRVGVVLAAAGVSRGQYYYSPKGGKRGRPVSTHTHHGDGSAVNDAHIAGLLRGLLAGPFVDYGHRKCAAWLGRAGWLIGRKKVLRIMAEHALRLPAPRRHDRTKHWAVKRQAELAEPLGFVQADFKYVWLSGVRRHAYLLTLLDVRTRAVLDASLGWRMDAAAAVGLLSRMLARFPMAGKVWLRTDNGPAFTAAELAEYLRGVSVDHEFCWPSTPQQNAFIESWHSTLERCVCKKFEFIGIEHARRVLSKFIAFYNHERLHSGIGYVPPMEYAQELGVDITPFLEPVNLTKPKTVLRVQSLS